MRSCEGGDYTEEAAAAGAGGIEDGYFFDVDDSVYSSVYQHAKAE